MFFKAKAFVVRTLCVTLAVAIFHSLIAVDLLKIKEVCAADLSLPAAAKLISLSDSFELPVLRGIKFNPENPFVMDFIVDQGSSLDVSNEESSKLLRYFLTALTVPENKLWVNLSPYEKDRILDDSLANTELGETLLKQDYLLKQLSSSLTYPETKIGQKYWNGIAGMQSSAPSLDKIWISTDSVELYDGEDTVFIKEAILKVETAADYQGKLDATSSNELIRNVLLPEIAHDVNKGRNFAPLRQLYYSAILAQWFKKKFANSLYSFYYNSQKTVGLDVADPMNKESIFAKYVEAFEEGTYNYIKKERDINTDRLVKKNYFSGGADASLDLDKVSSSPLGDDDLDRDFKLFSVHTRGHITDETGHSMDLDKFEGLLTNNGTPWKSEDDYASSALTVAEKYELVNKLQNTIPTVKSRRRGRRPSGTYRFTVTLVEGNHLSNYNVQYNGTPNYQVHIRVGVDSFETEIQLRNDIVRCLKSVKHTYFPSDAGYMLADRIDRASSALTGEEKQKIAEEIVAKLSTVRTITRDQNNRPEADSYSWRINLNDSADKANYSINLVTNEWENKTYMISINVGRNSFDTKEELLKDVVRCLRYDVEHDYFPMNSGNLAAWDLEETYDLRPVEVAEPEVDPFENGPLSLEWKQTLARGVTRLLDTERAIVDWETKEAPAAKYFKYNVNLIEGEAKAKYSISLEGEKYYDLSIDVGVESFNTKDELLDDLARCLRTIEHPHMPLNAPNVASFKFKEVDWLHDYKALAWMASSALERVDELVEKIEAISSSIEAIENDELREQCQNILDDASYIATELALVREQLDNSLEDDPIYAALTLRYELLNSKADRTFVLFEVLALLFNFAFDDLSTLETLLPHLLNVLGYASVRAYSFAKEELGKSPRRAIAHNALMEKFEEKLDDYITSLNLAGEQANAQTIALLYLLKDYYPLAVRRYIEINKDKLSQAHDSFITREADILDEAAWEDLLVAIRFDSLANDLVEVQSLIDAELKVEILEEQMNELSLVHPEMASSALSKKFKFALDIIKNKFITQKKAGDGVPGGIQHIAKYTAVVSILIALIEIVKGPLAGTLSVGAIGLVASFLIPMYVFSVYGRYSMLDSEAAEFKSLIYESLEEYVESPADLAMFSFLASNFDLYKEVQTFASEKKMNNYFGQKLAYEIKHSNSQKLSNIEMYKEYISPQKLKQVKGLIDAYKKATSSSALKSATIAAMSMVMVVMGMFILFDKMTDSYMEHDYFENDKTIEQTVDTTEVDTSSSALALVGKELKLYTELDKGVSDQRAKQIQATLTKIYSSKYILAMMLEAGDLKELATKVFHRWPFLKDGVMKEALELLFKKDHERAEAIKGYFKKRDLDIDDLHAWGSFLEDDLRSVINHNYHLEKYYGEFTVHAQNNGITYEIQDALNRLLNKIDEHKVKKSPLKSKLMLKKFVNVSFTPDEKMRNAHRIAEQFYYVKRVEDFAILAIILDAFGFHDYVDSYVETARTENKRIAHFMEKIEKRQEGSLAHYDFWEGELSKDTIKMLDEVKKASSSSLVSGNYWDYLDINPEEIKTLGDITSPKQRIAILIGLSLILLGAISGIKNTLDVADAKARQTIEIQEIEKQESNLGGVDLSGSLDNIKVSESTAKVKLSAQQAKRITGLSFTFVGEAKTLPLRQIIGAPAII